MNGSPTALSLALLMGLIMAGCGSSQLGGEGPPRAAQGVLDLSDWDFERDGSVRLDGGWEFYWKRLLEPGDFADGVPPPMTGFFAVPDIWNGYEVDGKPLSGDGYATFRLTIDLGETERVHALRLMVMATAYRLWANGAFLAANGRVGTSPASSVPQSLPQVAVLPTGGRQLELVLQVSNFAHKKGGVWDVIELGTTDQIHKRQRAKEAFEAFLFGSLLIMALYHFGLFGLRPRDHSTLYFGVFCLLVGARLLVTGECFLIAFFPDFSWELAFKIEYLTMYLALPVFVAFIGSLFPDGFSRVVGWGSSILGAALGLVVLFTPTRIFSHTLLAYQPITMVVGSYLIFFLIRSLLRRREGSALLAAGSFVLLVTVINDFLFAYPLIYTGYLVPFGLFIFIFAQSLVSSMRFSRAFNTIERQSMELEETNAALTREIEVRGRVEEELRRSEDELRRHRDGLEDLVVARTASLATANQQLQEEMAERKRGEEERARLEVRIQQADKMEALGNLAGGVAHALNNILAGIIGFPELLLMDLPEDSPLREPLEIIKRSGERAAETVQDLLTLARRGVSSREVVNANDTINSVLESPEYRQLMLFHPNVEVETNLEPDLLSLLGSPLHLSKAFMNLVTNAAEAMPDGGCLTTTENRYLDRPIKGYDDVAEGDYVVVNVADTGTGIRPEDMARIFEPFYTKKQMGRSGTGLGMTVVWGTVKDHSGYIDMQSGPGAGTAFTLFFPVTQQEPSLNLPGSSIEDYLGAGESVLVVDDVAEQRHLASSILGKLGYAAAAVSSGEEAVGYLQENAADLIVLDMIMDPGMDGLDTYRRILEQHPGQKAIIASGFSETDRVEEAQRLGAGAYVRKPYLIEKLGRAVRSELDS